MMDLFATTPTASELVDDTHAFFAPVSSDLVDSLVGQYQAMRQRISRVAEVIASPDLDGALHYFADAAGRNDRHLSRSTVATMFDEPGATAALNASFWSKAMRMTDVLDCMPQKRRDEWHKSISEHLAPDFTDETVRATLKDLLSQRQKFFAERVDGIFRALSGEHVTNAPEAFGKRMIVSRVINEWGSPDHSRTGTINDLRVVVAKFMGRDEPKWDASDSVVRYARSRPGEWIRLDGGALRIRCYKVGTAHLEVHPDMAWRLNQVLAGLYPLAIPAKFRQRPIKQAKEFQMLARPLPFAVLAVLAGLEQARDLNQDRGYRTNAYIPVPGIFALKYGSGEGSHAEAGKVLEMIGGTPAGQGRWAFDYDPLSVVRDIVSSGCLPDKKAHQYYPTPRPVGQAALALARVESGHSVLEPSAGQGALAELMPVSANVTCVEISKLHCAILESKGFATIQADFLEWSKSGALFDRVLMNPPFSEGRWQAHLLAAVGCVKQGGRLVAILPASAKGKSVLPGWSLDWSSAFDNQFQGTGVSVVLLTATRE